MCNILRFVTKTNYIYVWLCVRSWDCLCYWRWCSDLVALCMRLDEWIVVCSSIGRSLASWLTTTVVVVVVVCVCCSMWYNDACNLVLNDLEVVKVCMRDNQIHHEFQNW